MALISRSTGSFDPYDRLYIEITELVSLKGPFKVKLLQT